LTINQSTSILFEFRSILCFTAFDRAAGCVFFFEFEPGPGPMRARRAAPGGLLLLLLRERGILAAAACLAAKL
jgi:hypothetical protein